jgi:hypothetical protein
MSKRVVFDFDGVIHSYTSGWQGLDVISDPPVPGIAEAIRDIRAAGFEVAVVSSRCAQKTGIKAINKYLKDNSIEVDTVTADKLPAICYIDDRAMYFDGHTHSLLERIKTFTPWQQRGNTSFVHISTSLEEQTPQENGKRVMGHSVTITTKGSAIDIAVAAASLLNALDKRLEEIPMDDDERSAAIYAYYQIRQKIGEV